MSEKLANPASLGLIAFGLTTVLLNISNAGYFGINSMIVAIGLAYGGLAQIIVGAMEFKRGNTFGLVAFSSYGFFWWSFVGLLVLPHLTGIGSALIEPQSVAAYLFMWGVFTFLMFFGTLKTNRVLQFVFMSLAILFFLLTAYWQSGATNADFIKITGYEGIICGMSAAYLGLAEVINEANGKTILPIWPITK
ncbi:MAG: acetate uptake transporter [Candidatus Bathyarchaeia archaeon]|jgi:succinate-acetate transporter protein